MRSKLPVPEAGSEKSSDPALAFRAWEKLPRETDTAYAYFQAYLEQAYPQGYGGTFTPRNRADLERELRLTRGALQGYATTFHWDQRAGQWDREVDRRLKEAQLGAVETVKSAHLRLAKKARTLGENELDKLLAASGRDHETPVLTAKEALAIADWGAKLERALTNNSTPEDLAGPGVDLSKLGLEDLEAMADILAKAKKT